MELEIYDALQSAGVSPEKAKAAVESINKEIDRRYALHAVQLATRGDVEQVKVEIAKVESNLVKWLVATALVIIGAIAALLSRIQ
jgi:type II secretory pathway component PulM